MRRVGKIIAYGEARKGQSQRGPWCFTPVTVKWKEETRGVNDEDHSVTMDVRGEVNKGRVETAIRNEEQIEFSVYFESREWKTGRLNSVSGYIPKEFLVDERTVVQPL